MSNAWDITFNNVPFDEQYTTINTQNYKIETSDISQLHTQTISISYKINPMSFILRPLIFAIIFAAILGIYAYARTEQKAHAPEEEEIVNALPIREIREFVKLYEEKNALNLDIEKAEEDLVRRKIQKKSYNQTVKGYTDKIKEINDDLVPFKETLMSSDSKIQNLVQQLDYLEAEKGSVKDSILLLEDRYKRGKLPSKAAYDRLNNDLTKRSDTIQKKVDTCINELRAFLV